MMQKIRVHNVTRMNIGIVAHMAIDVVSSQSTRHGYTVTYVNKDAPTSSTQRILGIKNIKLLLWHNIQHNFLKENHGNTFRIHKGKYKVVPVL
jgi:hypothetical protein